MRAHISIWVQAFINLNAPECMKKAQVDCTLCYMLVQHKRMHLANMSDSQCEWIPHIYVSGNMGKCKLTDAHTHVQCLRTKARNTSCAGAGITCTQRQTQRTHKQMFFQWVCGSLSESCMRFFYLETGPRVVKQLSQKDATKTCKKSSMQSGADRQRQGCGRQTDLGCRRRQENNLWSVKDSIYSRLQARC